MGYSLSTLIVNINPLISDKAKSAGFHPAASLSKVVSSLLNKSSSSSYRVQAACLDYVKTPSLTSAPQTRAPVLFGLLLTCAGCHRGETWDPSGVACAMSHAALVSSAR